MPSFGETSRKRLGECHVDIRRVMNEVIKHFDCSILCGYRNQADQDAAVARGASKVKFPNSKHNSAPSMAVDVVPYPIKWPDQEKDFNLSQADENRIYYFAGFVMEAAKTMGIDLRWGGDWDGDTDLRDQAGRFTDLPHFELRS